MGGSTGKLGSLVGWIHTEMAKERKIAFKELEWNFNSRNFIRCKNNYFIQKIMSTNIKSWIDWIKQWWQNSSEQQVGEFHRVHYWVPFYLLFIYILFSVDFHSSYPEFNVPWTIIISLGKDLSNILVQFLTKNWPEKKTNSFKKYEQSLNIMKLSTTGK